MSTTISAPRRWSGRILSGLVVAFMLFDGVTKIMRVPPVVEATVKLGYPASAVAPIGVLAVLGAVLYAIPRTAIVGAVVLTGFLGGAIATQLRVEAPLLTHTLFPVYFAIMIWGGLALRDPRAMGLLAPR
jgi:hypothetical protein